MPPEPPITADQTEFLTALGEWSGRTTRDFPALCPPCKGTGHADEDAILARVFAEVASTAPYHSSSHTLGVVTAAIIVHQRRIDLAWDAARTTKPGQYSDRSAWKQLGPYEEMVAVLHSWLDALWSTSVEVPA